MVVARGTMAGAKKWMNTYKFPFQLFLDLEMKFYRTLGLRRSAKSVWTVAALVEYAEEHLVASSPFTSYEGDDVHVMGGDFLTDFSGKLVYVHKSCVPSDRPTTEQVLSVLDAALVQEN